MRLLGNWNNHVAFPYKLITGPAGLVVSLSEVKDFLKLDSSDTSEDTIITLLIETATSFAEKFTKRDFVNKTYLTYRDTLDPYIEIRRSKLQSISFIKYYDTTDTLQTVSSAVYGFTDDSDFSSVYVALNQTWPTAGVSTRPSPIQIQFVAGYGATSASVPSPLRQAILQHVASLYESRGDCGSESCGSPIPGSAKAILAQYKINDITGRSFFTAPDSLSGN